MSFLKESKETRNTNTMSFQQMHDISRVYLIILFTNYITISRIIPN